MIGTGLVLLSLLQVWQVSRSHTWRHETRKPSHITGAPCFLGLPGSANLPLVSFCCLYQGPLQYWIKLSQLSLFRILVFCSNTISYFTHCQTQRLEGAPHWTLYHLYQIGNHYYASYTTQQWFTFCRLKNVAVVGVTCFSSCLLEATPVEWIKPKETIQGWS